MADTSIALRPATREDVLLVVAMIRELAVYEELESACRAEEAALRRHLFGPTPRAEVVIAEIDGVAAGFALFFHGFSTFACGPTLYLEDLFVRPAHRGRGAGRALLARLAAVAVERGCPRVDWAVLDWNAPAIGFYRALGAAPLDGWTTFRLEGDALAALAAGGRAPGGG